MFRRWFSLVGLLLLVMAVLLLTADTASAWGWRGGYGGGGYGWGGYGWGGYGRGYYGWGGYSPGYYGWGSYYPGYYGSGYSPSYYSSGYYPAYSGYYGYSYPYSSWSGSAYGGGFAPVYYSYDTTPARYGSGMGSYQSGYYSGQNDQDRDAAFVEIHVPPDAAVWFNGQRTRQSGSDRPFISPPLTPGKEYTYDIRARWMGDDGAVDRTRTITVRAGSSVNVDFNRREQGDRSTEKPSDRPVTGPTDSGTDKPADRPVSKPTDKPADK